MRPTLVFSHANGFPAGTYRLLFEAWRDAGYQVAAIDRYGHHPDYPVTSNWPKLRDQIAAFIDAQAGPVHLVGHSLGGYLSLLGAARRPKVVQRVVLLDSPVVAGWRAHSLHALKVGRLIHRVSPGRISQRRRWQWPSAEAAWQHFAGKVNFARWQPDVLRDYIAAGTEPDPDTGGVRLSFRREVETAIYNGLPHDVASVLRRHPLKMPVAYVAGTRSAEGRQVGLAATRALVHERITWIEGTHLFPMERPAEAAAAVLKWLD